MALLQNPARVRQTPSLLMAIALCPAECEGKVCYFVMNISDPVSQLTLCILWGLAFHFHSTCCSGASRVWLFCLPVLGNRLQAENECTT